MASPRTKSEGRTKNVWKLYLFLKRERIVFTEPEGRLELLRLQKLFLRSHRLRISYDNRI